MANHCWNWVVLEGSKTALTQVESRMKKYDKTNYFTEFCDYVLKRGKIGEYEKNYAHLINAKPKPNKTSYKNGDKFTDIDMSIPYATYLKYGTRWFDFEMEGDDTFLQIQGSSAWSPPIKFFVDLCEVYNLNARMEYEECGMDFAGKLKISPNGITQHFEMTADEFNYLEDYHAWCDRQIDHYGYEEDGDKSFIADYKGNGWLDKAHFEETLKYIKIQMKEKTFQSNS